MECIDAQTVLTWMPSVSSSRSGFRLLVSSGSATFNFYCKHLR